ncbi:MAG: hypothetical protein NDI75_06660 [Candidatus Didemnitutus sp.]|nr:hypothetical protein [Candidatus Didemnitutus sp.]
MPRRAGQAKIREGSLEAIREAALGGNFASSEAFELYIDGLGLFHYGHVLRPEERERCIAELNTKAGHRVMLALERGNRSDVEFLNDLAKMAMTFPSFQAVAAGERVARDPVLLNLEFIVRHGSPAHEKWSAGELVDRLLGFGVRCTTDDVRAKAKLLGLKLDSKRGPKPRRSASE